jgi:predicted dehydrogenase
MKSRRRIAFTKAGTTPNRTRLQQGFPTGGMGPTNETRAWLDFLSTGRPSVHATPEQAMLNLRTTYAIERAVATGQAVRLD